MPSYDFHCDNCKRTETFILSIADRDIVQACPECLEKMERVFSSEVSFKFDGKGTYLSGFDSYKK